jgi:hypothetical protein
MGTVKSQTNVAIDGIIRSLIEIERTILGKKIKVSPDTPEEEVIIAVNTAVIEHYEKNN